MLVYVLNQNSQPLMPCSPCKARKLLKRGKAIVFKTEPFTIQLLYGASRYKQIITLGIDAGSKVVGLSATTETKELYSGEIQLRNDIVNLLSTRRQNRRTRRARLRYRKPRFSNRVKSKNKGWLAASIENKIQTHLTVVKNLHKILPISKIIVEVASFDLQKIKNLDIAGKDYQQGDQMDFWNVREYVLFRDGHRCHGKKGCKNKILNVHHITSRKTGGDSPSNLKTLCKEHRVDALCISGNPLAIRLDYFYFLKKVRCHNRQIHKANLLKGGIKKLNQAQFEVKGFRLFDKVQYQGKLYFVFGRRNSGFFDIRTLDGIKVNKGSFITSF